MSIYTNSNVMVTGGSSTYVAGNHIEVHELEERSTAFEKLCQHIAPNALHNSGEVADQPKCHPGTRIAILDYLFAWAAAHIYAYPFIWLHGPAGAGKSAILRTIAQRLFDERLLLAGFFFFRTGERRNTTTYVTATIAYQLALCIPETRPHIEKAIERNPIIFSLSLWDQAQALIISPIDSVYHDPAFDPSPSPRIIVIDGLDECHDSSKQCEILQVLGRIIQRVPIPVAILLASRPEYHIRGEFNLGDLNKYSSRLALDDSYDPDSDIKKYLVDKFNSIHQHHPMKSFLPSHWPSQEVVDSLVAKASGQFIYATTVDKFISSPRHNPAKRLDVILGTLSAEGLRPFEQLDNLYSTIFCTIIEEDVASTLRILGVLLVPHFDSNPTTGDAHSNMMRIRFDGTRSPFFIERLLDLDSGDVQGLMFGLESLLTIGESHENIRFFHASLSDYLFDRSRSGQFWIDAESIYADLAEHCVRHLFDWPEIRNFFMWNSFLFFSKASPTSRLCQAIQECDFDQVIMASSNSEPHGLRDLCPTLLQVVIEKSKFIDVQKLVTVRLDEFKRIVAARIHEVYFASISLKSTIIAQTLISATIHDTIENTCFRLSPEEIWRERMRGFNLFITRKPPPIIPFIRTLLQDVNSGCFVNGNEYADVALYIFESFVGSNSDHFYISPSLSKILAELVPPLLGKSSIHADLVQYVEKFTRLRWQEPGISKEFSTPILKAIGTYILRQQRYKKKQTRRMQPDTRAPLPREIIDLTTPPPENQQTGRKRLQQEPEVLDLTRETPPLSEPSSSRTFKRVRTTEWRVSGTCPGPLADPSSVTKKTFHASNCSYTEGRYAQSQTGKDVEHAIVISDSE